jgi:hypothetical protein
MQALVGTLLRISVIVLAGSSAVFAQDDGNSSNQPQNHASGLDARQIMGASVAATERSWQARGQYTYTERDEDRRLDAEGKIRSNNVEVSRMILANGARFGQVLEHNGQPPSAKEQNKLAEDLEKLKHETSEERTVRFRKDLENRSFLEEVLQAFDFQLLGEEIADTRSAYVLQATPHAGYRPQGKYGKMFSKVEGKLWIDKEDFGWIKVEGQVTQSFSMGLFVARVQRGSHMILEQISLGDGVWVPKHLQLRARATIFFIKGLDVERVLTYSDYRPAVNGQYSVSR